MSLTAERHTEVEALLQRINDELVALAAELDRSVGVNGRSHSADTTRYVIRHLALLRYDLEREQEWRRSTEAYRRRFQ
jgi:hypothetical protein